MREFLTEALLEMHFHSALVDYFTKKYGARQLKLIKPSQYKEAWVGFDQAWVPTTISTSELYDNISKVVSDRTGKIKKLYIGYFLQFKCVDLLSKRSKYTPEMYNLPYYRSELNLSPNKQTGLSQHETLTILSKIKNSSVYYACGMLFNIMDIYSKPDMEKLRLIPVKDAPSTIRRNERHFIAFQEPNTVPYWCSDPVEGKGFSFEEWASGNLEDGPRLLQASEAMEYIKTMQHILLTASEEGKAKLLEEELRRRELLEQERRLKQKADMKVIEDKYYSNKFVADRVPQFQIEDKQPKKEVNLIPGSFNLLEFVID